MSGKRKITVSRVYERLSHSMDVKRSRYIVMCGGRGSTKTFSILQKIITKCLDSKRPLRVCILRAKLTWLKSTAIEDFKDILKSQFGIWRESDFNKSEMFYMLNGSKVQFIGLDQEAGFQRAHGMKNDIVYFNECVELDHDSVRQVLMRTTGTIIFDFNPNCGANHWIYDDILKRDGADYIHSTYKDNPWLERKICEEIEAYKPTEENIARGSADETLWKIYGLGQRAVVSGLIFPSYELVKSMPESPEKEGLGLDFGFSIDPTAVVRCAIHNGDLYLEQLIYRRELTTIINPHNPRQRSIEGELQKLRLKPKIKIWADKARPDQIRDLQNCGYNIEGSGKGPGSIKTGIDVMKRHRLKITEASLDLIKEVNNYKWKIERSGEPTNEPVDKFNHAIDAARYWVMGEIGGGGGFSMKDRIDSARMVCVSETYAEV